MKRKKWTLTPWFIIFGVVMLLMSTFMSAYSMPLFYAELGLTVLTVAAVIVLSLRFQRGYS